MPYTFAYFCNFALIYTTIQMQKNICLAIVASAFLLIACGGKGEQKKAEDQATSTIEMFPGDSNVYGLMCDGGSDSVLYLLPPDGSDPVKYDITVATRRRRILGDPQIGNWIAVVPNPKDKKVADMVVDLETLKGTWCYAVMPELRASDDMTDAMKKKFLNNMSDSIRDIYFVPREYGFTLKRRYLASSVGWVRHSSALEDESPVVYPKVPLYRQWHMVNSQLVLGRLKDSSMKPSNTKTKDGKMPVEELVNDTADILMLHSDTLVLRFKDNRIQGYYRIENADDANKLAKQKAEVIAKQAEEKIMDKDTASVSN